MGERERAWNAVLAISWTFWLLSAVLLFTPLGIFFAIWIETGHWWPMLFPLATLVVVVLSE